MRYIDKANRSTDFDLFVSHYKNALKNKEWEGLKKIASKNGFPSGGEVKLILYQHLWYQQKGLCIYCEQQLEEKLDKNIGKGFSHIEHIKPKNIYKELRFEQSNLTVSCDGFDTRNQNPQTERDFCGHKKLSNYDESLFLNPLEVENIEDYFDYDIEGNIFPNKDLKKEEKAKSIYTIDILNLQHLMLIDMRKEQYGLILNQYLSYETEDEQNEYVDDLLNPDYNIYPAFYSMLKRLFQI